MLLYPAFELQHNMRKAVMGNRYWRNREGPHFTEKDIVLINSKSAMAPHQEDLSAGHKKLNEDVRRKGGCALLATRNLSGRRSIPGGTARRRRSLSERCQAGSNSPAVVPRSSSSSSREEFEAQAVHVLLEQEEEGRAQKKGLKGSLVAGTHGVTSASGAKRRRWSSTRRVDGATGAVARRREACPLVLCNRVVGRHKSSRRRTAPASTPRARRSAGRARPAKAAFLSFPSSALAPHSQGPALRVARETRGRRAPRRRRGHVRRLEERVVAVHNPEGGDQRHPLLQEAPGAAPTVGARL